MFSNRKNSIAGWLLLFLIGTSVIFSTLHSHHHLEWDHTDSHVDTGHCLVDDTNTCPVSGYLFNADIAERLQQPPLTAIADKIVILSESQRPDPFTDQPNGRSPPLIG